MQCLDLLRNSVRKLRAQFALINCMDVNVEQVEESPSQFVDMSSPHQKVSAKKVKRNAETVIPARIWRAARVLIFDGGTSA
jgi:tRNA A37 N6-isopentenylltransferase MiaA